MRPLDPDIVRRLASVADTLERAGAKPFPINFHQLAHDIRAALAAIAEQSSQQEA